MENDIKNLFKKIDGKADAYQEIHRDELNEQAKQRWPLLRDVRANVATPHPLRNASLKASPKAVAVSVPPEIISQDRHVVSSVVREERVPFTGFSPKVVTVSQESRAPESSRSGIEPNQENVAGLPKSLFAAVSAAATPSEEQNEKNKDISLHVLFERLAQKNEPEQLPESPVNSFFKKIFKP